MKKISQRAIALLLVLAAVCSLLSCRRNKDPKDPTPGTDPGEKEAAVLEAERVRAFLASVGSYREKTETTLTFPYEGAPLTLKSSADITRSGLLSEEAFYCNTEEREALYSGNTELSSLSRTSGFAEGKMYLAGEGQKLCSGLSAAEYLAFSPIADRTEFLSVLDDCALVGYAEDGTGSRIVITGLGASAVADLEERFSAMEDRVGVIRITDAKTTVQIDAAHRPVSSEIRFTFSSAQVSMTVRTEYSEWNALPSRSPADLSGYRLTGDLRQIETAALDYRAKCESETQDFLLQIDTVRKNDAKTLSSSVSYDVTAKKNGEGKYLAGIVFESDAGGRSERTYANGKLRTVDTMISSGEELGRMEQTMTDEEMRAEVQSLSDIQMPTDMIVTDVVRYGDTLRISAIRPDLSGYEDTVTVTGTPEAILDFVYEEGKLVRLVCTMVFDGLDLALKDYYGYTVTETITFR